MADEGTTTSASDDAGGGDDSEAQGMLAEAVNDDGGSQEDQSDAFDADKAKAKITKANNEAKNLRARIKELEPLAQEAQKLRDSQKSELEKLTDRASQAEDRATTAELASTRLEVALDKAPEGMPISKIRALAKRLTGSTREELETDAGELFAEFAPPKGDESNGTQRPKEQLSSVRLPNSDQIQLDDETDPKKLAANIRRL